MKNPKELFKAIVELSSKALGNEVENIEVKEEVVLAEEETKEVETKEAVKEEAPSPAPVDVPVAVSKVEFDSAIAEIKEMYTKVLESISPSTPQEVPAKLSEEVKEEVVEVKEEEVVEVKEEVAEEIVEEVKEEVIETKSEEIVDDLIHTPEAVVETRPSYLYAQNRNLTTEDHVFKTLFNK
jgi:hypothetical protein